MRERGTVNAATSDLPRQEIRQGLHKIS